MAHQHKIGHSVPYVVKKVIQGHWIWRQSRASVQLPISD